MSQIAPVILSEGGERERSVRGGNSASVRRRWVRGDRTEAPSSPLGPRHNVVAAASRPQRAQTFADRTADTMVTREHSPTRRDRPPTKRSLVPEPGWRPYLAEAAQRLASTPNPMARRARRHVGNDRGTAVIQRQGQDADGQALRDPPLRQRCKEGLR